MPGDFRRRYTSWVGVSNGAIRGARVIILGAAALSLSGLAAGAARTERRVLVVRPGAIAWHDVSTPEVGVNIPEFGVNGTRLRWVQETAADGSKSRTLDIDASASAVTSRWPAGLAFSAGRTASRHEGGGNVRYNSLGVSKGRRGAQLEEFQLPDEGSGGYLMPPHALGPYIVYGWHETGRTIKGSCDPDGFACEYAVERGGIRLIEGLRRGRLVTDVPVAAFTLSNTGTVAYVRATNRWRYKWGPSVVETITLWSPRVLQRIYVPGKVTELAVSDRVLVAKTSLGSTSRTAALFYDLWSAKHLRTFRGQEGLFYWFALKGSTAVLTLGRKLVALNAYTGSKRVLHRSRGESGPHAAAFAGDDLVWYEPHGAAYRVMSMSVGSG